MAVLGLWGLSRGSAMGNDEVATKWAALLSLRQLVHLLHHVDAVHGLYYLLMHCWVIVGSSPAALRVPSVLAAVAAVIMVAVLGRRLTGSAWAGLFAGLIMALTPSISFYAQTARSYALVLACVLASTLALLAALKAETAAGTPAAASPSAAPRWVLYAALIALGGYLNEMALLVLAAHGVTVLLARYGRRAVGRWIAAAAAGAIVVVPLLALSVRQDQAVSWITRPGLASLQTLFHDYFGVTTVVAVILLICAVIALVPDRRTGQEAPWWRQRGISLPSVAAPLLVLPAGLLLAESTFGTRLYVDRYVLYGEAGAALLAGAGACRLGQWLARLSAPQLVALPGLLICAVALVAQLGPQSRIRTPESRMYDFGGPSRYLAAGARPGDGVLFLGTLFRKAELGYPADFRQVTDFAMAESPTRAGNFRGTDKPVATVDQLMLGYHRIWVVGPVPSAALPAPLGQESGALLSRFSLAGTHHFKGITVTLWIRR